MLNSIVEAGGEILDSLKDTIIESTILTDYLRTDKTYADWHAKPLPEVGKWADENRKLNQTPMIRIYHETN